MFSISAAAPWVITQTDADPLNITTIKADTANPGQVLITTATIHDYAVGDLITLKNTTHYDGCYNISRVIDTETVSIPHRTTATANTGTVAKGDNALSDILTDIPNIALGTPDVLNSFAIGQIADRHRGLRMHGDVRIVINGALQIDEREELWVNDNVNAPTIDIGANGTLILGHEEMINGALYRPDWCPLKFTRSLENDKNKGDLRILGKLIQYGGTIYSGGVVYFAPDSEVRLIQGKLIGTAGSGITRVVQESKNLTIEDNYAIEGSARIDMYYQPQQTTGFRPAYVDNGTFRARGRLNIGVYEFENFDARGITYAGDCFNASKVQFKNLAYDKELLVTHNSPGAKTPVTKVMKEFILHVTDIHGMPLDFARFYIVDTDNGRRPANGTYRIDSQIESFDTDRIHNIITLRGGISQKIDILTRTLREGHSIGHTYGASNAGSVGSNTTIVDYRGKNDTYDDLFDVHIWHYSHLYKVLKDISMRGPGILHVTAELVPDPYVTATREVANTYQGRFTVNHITTTIHVTIDSTLDQLYDYIKVVKNDSHVRFDQGFEPITYPTLDKAIGTAEGTTLDVGEMNIVVDNGITLSGGKKLTTLKTTGTITGNVRSGKHDTAGITAVITPEQSDTAIYYRAYSANGTFRDGYATGGPFEIMIQDGGYIVAVAKAPKHKYHKFTVTHDNPTYVISLESEPHVKGVDLSAYRQDPDGLADNNMYPMYNAGKTKLHYGKINLSTKIETSKAILDDRMQSEEGMKFLFHFSQSRLEEEYLLAEDGAGVAYAFNRNADKLNPKSFSTTLREFVDWTSHDGLVFGLQGTHVRKVKVFLEDGTRVPDRDFNLEINFPRSISYHDGLLLISDNNARMVFAFTAPTMARKGGIRENDKNYALDHEGGNVDPRGADHINGVHYIMDGTAKKTFNYAGKTRDPTDELDVSMLVTPRGVAHLFGRTYVLDTGDDDTEGEIRAFTGGVRDLANDIGATNNIASIGAIRRYGTWPDSIVGGRPYLIEFDRIQINSAKLEYVRIPGMMPADLSHAGLYVADENESTYVAPLSHGGRVLFNPSQHIISGDTIRVILEKLLADPAFLKGIKDKIEERGGKLDTNLQILQNDYDITPTSFKIKKHDNTSILRAYTKDTTGSRTRTPGDED